MIMNNRNRNSGDESPWEKLEAKLKKMVYSFMHELLQSQVCTPFLYKLLVFIEMIQILYYSIHPNLSFLWNATALDYLRTIIQYFQINSIIEEGNANVILVIMYFVFSINFIALIMIIVTSCRISSTQRNKSTFLTYGIKILSGYGLLLNTIIAIPFYNIYIAVLYCKEDSSISQNFTCNQGIYILHIVISVFGLIFLVMLSMLFTNLYIDLNPNSTIPFAQPQSSTNFFKLILKIFLPFYMIIDYNRNWVEEYIVLMVLAYLLLLIQRYRSAPNYNRSVHSFQILCDIVLFWVTVCSLITAFIDTDTKENIGIFYMILMIPVVLPVVHSIIANRNWAYMKMSNRNFKKDTDVEMYLCVLIYLIETRNRPEQRIKLEGLLKYHQIQCQKIDTCNCQKVYTDQAGKDDDTTSMNKKWYLFLFSILNDGLEKFPKSAKLHVLHSHIQQEKLKNKFKALYELMMTEECKPNMQEEFSIYR